MDLKDNSTTLPESGAKESEIMTTNEEEWRSPVIKNKDGGVVGAALFITKEDLTELNINPKCSGEILYKISGNGVIEVRGNRHG